MAEKKQIDFTLRGFRYTDIPYYLWDKSDDKKITVTVAGSAKMIRQLLKARYPWLKTWVQSESYSGGDSIRIYAWNAPDDVAEEINRLGKSFQESNFDGMTYSYTYSKQAEQSDEGYIVDYGAKYVFTENRPPYSSPERDQTPPDYSKLRTQGQPSRPSGGGGGGYKPRPVKNEGELIRECPAGWSLYKVIINVRGDDKQIFKLRKAKETPPNKDKWDDIRGGMQVRFGFKWNRIDQSFERWSNSERLDIEDELCNFLEQYYPMGQSPAPQPAPTQAPEQETPNGPQEESDVIDKKIRGFEVMLRMETDEAEKELIMKKIRALKLLR